MQNTSTLVVRALRQPSRSQLQQLAGRKRTWQHRRSFHQSRRLDIVKPFVLADIGEGITEVQIIQWFVKPGARVEQFDKLCEVQSDKASVEITSRFDGVIKKLHYEQDDTAKVGKPLCDIDIEGEISPGDEALLSPDGEQAGGPGDAQQPQKEAEKQQQQQQQQQQSRAESSGKQEWRAGPPSEEKSQSNGHVSTLATPAVRGLLKELGVSIEDVKGTGKDGRVLKEDVHSHVATRDATTHSEKQQQQRQQQSDIESKPRPARPSRPRPASVEEGPQQETVVPLNPIQAQMFKVMTRSLSIPHFLYSDEVDLSPLSTLRRKLNIHPSSQGKLSFLPFVIKAVSLSLDEFPLLNSRVEVPPSNLSSSSSSTSPPKLVMRAKHNIGVAMDTPQGLLVPNIKNVAALSIREIATRLSELQDRAQRGKLTTTDLTGGTITVSNIGSIGGAVVQPVIVQGEVAILGMGRARVVPAFADKLEEAVDRRRGSGRGYDEDDVLRVVKKTVSSFSWSADHRVVDGATMARMAERVRALLEEPGMMMTELR